ncbi:MAG: stage V sporulation protein S [Oscillospiraceae bacterium]|jgi:stage V sporulation protein S|nr:stage V sporulation protein S [Oscillospiraceae bacterium]
MGTEIVKVSARSMPKLVAGAIAAIIRGGGQAEIQAVGAGATNQAVKAIAIARVYMEAENIDLICRPAFTEITIDGAEKTAIQLMVSRLYDSR